MCISANLHYRHGRILELECSIISTMCPMLPILSASHVVQEVISQFHTKSPNIKITQSKPPNFIAKRIVIFVDNSYIIEK